MTALATLMTLTACSGKEEQKEASDETPVVRIERVSEREVAQVSVYTASVEADKVNNISAMMSNRIKAIYVDEGQRVTRGQKLVVMDEPFVGLDPRASHLLKGFMHEICENGGSIFFSTHVLEVAEKLCNKIAIIKNGKIIRSGPTDEVRGDSSLEDLFLELTEQEDEQA